MSELSEWLRWGAWVGLGDADLQEIGKFVTDLATLCAQQHDMIARLSEDEAPCVCASFGAMPCDRCAALRAAEEFREKYS